MTNPLSPSALLTTLISSAAMRAILDDRARLQRMLDFEVALARAEAAVGIVPALATEQMTGGALPAPPLMHGAAHWNALSCWLSGGTIVLQDHPDRLDAHDVLATVARERLLARHPRHRRPALGSCA